MAQKNRMFLYTYMESRNIELYVPACVGGCWGQSMLLFQKLVDETQMPKSQEYTDIFILTKKLFLVSLRGLQNISNPVERSCSVYQVLIL